MALFVGIRSLIVLIELTYPIIGLVVLGNYYLSKKLRKPRALYVSRPALEVQR
jgi:hypothetical protein